MSHKPPGLRVKKNGWFFIRYGGKDHYLGTQDRNAAEKIFPKMLDQWADWKATVRFVRTSNTSKALTVESLAEQFIAAKVAQRGPQIRRYYREQLRNFLEYYGAQPAITMSAQRLQAFQSDLVAMGKLMPKTINHRTIAVKALFNWGADMGLMPAIRLRAIRALPLGEPEDRSIPMATIKGWLATCESAKGEHAESGANAAAWLAVNYLTLARPIEVCRVVCGVGKWVEHGVFRLGKSKVESKTGVAKRLVFSEEALAWLGKCKPLWSRSDSYWHGVRVHVPTAKPGLLRHSAATHLLRLYGTPRLDVETLLGHSTAIHRESVKYAGIEWQRCREIASRLTLR